MASLDRAFRLTENRTNVRTEILAGATTFATMSYIIAVQPSILSMPGCDMNVGAVMAATCLASAFATLLMGLWANYPIALAPAMGHNVFFAATVCGVMGFDWQDALGAVFAAGLVFLVLSLVRVREKIIAAVPLCLRHAIGAGIGLLIAFVGLQTSGLLVRGEGSNVLAFGGWGEVTTILSAAGLLVTGVLMARRVPGAILIGMAAIAAVCFAMGLIKAPASPVGAPPSLAPTFGQLRLPDLAARPEFLVVIITFLYLDLFDTVGTLIGVGERAGFMRNGELPRANRALASDAAGTSVGALLGTSTITSYIESCAGIASGGRTGLANVVTALLFLLALFIAPVFIAIGGGIALASGAVVNPITAPALILVGCMMMGGARHIDWDDYAEAIPAFLAMIFMVIGFNISMGISAGFLTFSLLKFVQGKANEVHWLTHFCGLLGALYFIFLLQ